MSLTVTIDNRSDVEVEAILGLEWTVTMLGGGGNPAAWWEVEGSRAAHDTSGTASGVTGLAQGNDYIGIAVATSVSAPADAWWAPIETVSNSGGRLRARLPGQPGCCSRGRSLEPGQGAHRERERSPSGHRIGATARDRAEVGRQQSCPVCPPGLTDPLLGPELARRLIADRIFGASRIGRVDPAVDAEADRQRGERGEREKDDQTSRPLRPPFLSTFGTVD